MTRVGLSHPNVHVVTPREPSLTAETLSLGVDTCRGNRPRLDITAADGRRIAVYLTAEQVEQLAGMVGK